MTELTIPPDAGEQKATRLVQEHVTVGDDVEVRKADRTGSGDPQLTGEVTGIEAGYLELDGKSLGGSVRYDEIHTIARLDSA
ncbi:hypothetical protein D8S78_08070 [Natrialba swarupiae]|nr:hypothetical protein [Natrialba swarupiae]